MTDFDQILSRIGTGELIPAPELLPYLSVESKHQRAYVNAQLAHAYAQVRTVEHYRQAKVFIERAWHQSGFVENLIPLYIQILSGLGDAAGVRAAWKRLGMMHAAQGDIGETIRCFDLWQYADTIVHKLDRFEYDFDVIEAIDQLAAPHRFYPPEAVAEAPPPGQKIRLAYLLKGITEPNSNLINIKLAFARFHDQRQFEVTCFFPEAASTIAQSAEAQAKIAQFEQAGAKIVTGIDSDDRAQRLLTLAQEIHASQPHLLITSAALAYFDHYFITALRPAPLTIGFTSGSAPLFTPPLLDWTITWSNHLQLDNLANSSQVSLEMALPQADEVAHVTRNRLNIPDDVTVLMSGGRYVKFQEPAFWQAIADLLTQHPQAYYVVIGPKPNTLPFLTELLPPAIRPRIQFFNWTSDYLQILAVADLVIDTFPSGGGMLLIDAMALGKPVVTFQNDDMARLHDQAHWSAGEQYIPVPDVVVPRNDFVQLKAIVTKLITDDAYRQQVAEICFDHIHQKYGNPARMVRRCETIYTEVIAQRRIDVRADQAAYEALHTQNWKAQLSDRDLFKGERAMPLAPNMPANIMREHWARYKHVAPLAAGKRVLDVACGAGYGTDFLAQNAKWVIGGDVSPETVQYSRSHYQRPNLHFGAMDIRKLPFVDKAVDLIVSFESIEHIVEGEQFLQEITRVLDEAGTLVISTPFGGPSGNVHHLAYYQQGTFAAYLQRFFEEVDLLFQRDDQFYEQSQSPAYAPKFTGEYGLAVCRKPKRVQPALTSIVVLTHNQLEHTRRCLESLERHTKQPYELIMVDNASTDGTVDFLRDYMADKAHVRVVANTENRGFAGGNNQGIALAKGEYVMLLNNDTVVTKGWLGRMLAVFERHPEVGVVGPVSNYVSGPQQVDKVDYNQKNLNGLQQFAAKWAKQHAGQAMEISRVVGFCLFARRTVIDRIGGLDEQFGSGNYEDDDFCIRALLAGFKVRVAKDSFIHHVGHQTFKGANINYRESMNRNWHLFKAKWGIPAETTIAEGYRISVQAPDISQYFSPVNPQTLLGQHQRNAAERWWQDMAGIDATMTDLLNQVEEAQNNQQWAEAITLLNQLLALPNFAQDDKAALWNSLGYSHFALNQLEQAETAFLTGLEIAPEHLDLLGNLADLYLHQKHYDKATAKVNRALTLNPDDVRTLLTLGHCAVQIGETETAQIAFRRVLQLAPETEGIADIVEQLTLTNA